MIFYTILCYFCLLTLLLVLVLEFVPGNGKSEQLLYDGHTYYRVGKSTKWICTDQKCNISLAVNTVEVTEPITKPSEITREPREHHHDRLTPCEIAVKRGIGLLKTDSLIQIESKPKTIYSNMVTNLTNQGHLIADLKVHSKQKKFLI